MRFSFRIQTIALASLALFSPAKADGGMTIETLLGSCNAPRASQQWFYCAGFLDGMSHTMSVVGAINAQTAQKASDFFSVSMCPTPAESISVDAEIRVFVNWANAHPEEWSKNDSFGVATALRETWPCQ